MLGRVRVVVGAADDVRDAGVVVVDDDREVVDGRAVGARDDEVVLERVLELASRRGRRRRRSCAPSSGTRRRTAPVPSSSPRKPRLPCASLYARTSSGPAVERYAWPPASSCSTTSPWRGGALRLEDRLAVPVDPEPLERLEDLRDVLRRGALAVGVLDPQHQLPALTAGEQPVVEGGAGAADVEGAGGRRGEADAHGRPSMLEPPAQMLIGAHVSPSGGPAMAVERGAELGANAIQIFNQNPRQWKPREYSDEEVAGFHAAIADSDVDALLIHAVYLLNCASEDTEIRDKSHASLTSLAAGGRQARRARVVLHPGSALKEGGDVDAGDRAGRQGDRRGAGRERRLPAAPRGHRRRGRDARALVRGAGAADRGRRRRTSGSASASTPATCSPRATTSAPRTTWPRCWTSSTASSGSTGSARCTATTR